MGYLALKLFDCSAKNVYLCTQKRAKLLTLGHRYKHHGSRLTAALYHLSDEYMDMRIFRYIYIIGIVAVLAIVGCGRGTSEKGLTHEEVVAINERVLEKAISSPDSALMMISSLRDTLPDYRCDYLRAKVYAQTLEGMWLDSAIIIGERLMMTDAARKDLAYRQDVLEMLINACRQHRDDELTIHWSTQLIDLCRQNGDETEALRTEAEIGLMLSGIGRADEGLAKIDSVIALLSGKRKFNELDASIIALKRKVNALKNSKLSTLNAQLDAAQQMLDLLADYEQHPDEYHDGTYREPPEHLRPGYIDFYRAQAYMFMTEAHANSQLSTLNSPLRKAKEYLSLFEQTDYAKSFSARKDMAPTYGLLGEYDKMLAIHDEQEALLRQQGDTVCAEYATILRDRAMAAEAQGRNVEANAYHRRYEALTATLNDRLLQGKANLYAARFHAAEQQREIDLGRVRANRAVTVAIAIGIIAIIALLFVYYIITKNRIINMKNQALIWLIDENIRYKQRLLQPSTMPEDTSPQALFKYLSNDICEQLLYLDPGFDRQAVCDRYHLTAVQVGSAFAQGSDYDSLSDFIRDCRLEHACTLLKNTDMKIADVMRASGFSRITTFNHDFKNKYKLSPTEFRQQ